MAGVREMSEADRLMVENDRLRSELDSARCQIAYWRGRCAEMEALAAGDPQAQDSAVAEIQQLRDARDFFREECDRLRAQIDIVYLIFGKPR